MSNSIRAVFKVELSHFKVIDLQQHHKSQLEKLHVDIHFADNFYITETEKLERGNVDWKFHKKFDFELSNLPDRNVDTLKRELSKRKMKVFVLCNHEPDDVLGNKIYLSQELGGTSLDLSTIATGPKAHNLPLRDESLSEIGRISFEVSMAQYMECCFIFHEVQVTKIYHKSITELNPYLKMDYSALWPLVAMGAKSANYSNVVHGTHNPVWNAPQIPCINFVSTISDMLQEGIVVHVTHCGTFHNTTLCGGVLPLRKLFEKLETPNGKIQFSGVLDQQHGTTISGKYHIEGLPPLFQMLPVFSHKPAVHTEKGIYDAKLMFPFAPPPDDPITLTEEVPINKETPHVERFRHDYFGQEMERGRHSPDPISKKEKKEEKLIDLDEADQSEAADAPLIQ